MLASVCTCCDPPHPSSGCHQDAQKTLSGLAHLSVGWEQVNS